MHRATREVIGTNGVLVFRKPARFAISKRQAIGRAEGPFMNALCAIGRLRRQPCTRTVHVVARYGLFTRYAGSANCMATSRRPACRSNRHRTFPAWVVTLSGPDLCMTPKCTTGRRNYVLNARTGMVVEMVGDV